MLYLNKTTIELVKSRYKNEEGEPFVLTSGQNEIFDIIVGRLKPRTQAITYTQYGKSDICALSVLTRITTYPEKWAIVAPTIKKAKIIMGYIIGHIFDNEYTRQKFQIGKDESLERIRRERSKERLTFRISESRIGEVFIISCEGKRVKDVLDALMGFGSPNIILDESGLISDPHYAGVKRMLGGHKDNFLLEIGNPFRRNHFLKVNRDSLYHHILIDYKQGIEEGRITEEFINEMRREAFFDVLYECKFPDEDSIDTQGYMPLFTETQLDASYVDDIDLFGEMRIGVDVGGGGSGKSVICLRGDNGARIEYSARSSDTMSLVGKVLEIAKENGVLPKHIFVDAIGVGKGVYDRLVEHKGNEVKGIIWGEKCEDEEDFADLKAQSFWRASQWLNGGKLKRHSGFEELIDIKYKVQSDKKVKIRSKEDMLKEGIQSPDHADAFALTFSTKKMPKIKKYKQPPYKPISEYEGRE